jgi:hypothetical protein
MTFCVCARLLFGPYTTLLGDGGQEMDETTSYLTLKIRDYFVWPASPMRSGGSSSASPNSSSADCPGSVIISIQIRIESRKRELYQEAFPEPEGSLAEL